MSWIDYEYEKRVWIEENPCAAPAQYEAAIRGIAERMGL